MNKDLINISAIETFFNGLLDKKVSSNTFVGSLPISIKAEWADIVVIDCATAIQDFNAYGRGTVLIYLYAKPQQSGKKNVPVLSNMEKKLNAAIALNSNQYYRLSRRGTYTDYDSNRNLHCNIIEIVTLIL